MLFRATFFYADDVLFASNYPVWLQEEFDTLTRLFNRVGLQTDVSKTDRMICHPFHAVGTQSEGAYEQHITGEELTYRARQQIWVQCPDCGADLEAGCLVVN